LERTIPLDKTGEGFMTTPEREAAYFADFEKFKDNKSKNKIQINYHDRGDTRS
jgi:hypothetical protein